MEREGHPLIGTDIGEIIGMDGTGHIITDRFTMTHREADVIIDFIPHETNLKYLRIVRGEKHTHRNRDKRPEPP